MQAAIDDTSNRICLARNRWLRRPWVLQTAGKIQFSYQGIALAMSKLRAWIDAAQAYKLGV